ncbi:YlbD family protein [Bacillus sp. 1P06AnD]|uniref:YlbD family protein n=1 Tax=Bacillus sp. 1P06AnD TaxID=3132208 RepID=UPI00399F16BE
MSDQQSLNQFKLFIRNHPSLVKEVRRGLYTWQEVYEDWFLLGEDHEVWDGYEEIAASEAVSETKAEESQSEKEKDSITAIFDSLKHVDVQSMQKHVANLSQALGAISGVISQFQKAPEPEEKTKAKTKHPFSMRRD